MLGSRKRRTLLVRRSIQVQRRQEDLAAVSSCSWKHILYTEKVMERA